MLGVHLDRERAELRLDDEIDAGLALERVHVFAGEIGADVRLTGLHHVPLLHGLAHDLPDRTGQIAAARLPRRGDALELIEIARLRALQLERT